MTFGTGRFPEAYVTRKWWINHDYCLDDELKCARGNLERTLLKRHDLFLLVCCMAFFATLRMFQSRDKVMLVRPAAS